MHQDAEDGSDTKGKGSRTKNGCEKKDWIDVEGVLLTPFFAFNRRLLLLAVAVAGSSTKLSILLVDREEGCYSLASVAGEAPEQSCCTVAVAHLSEILLNIGVIKYFVNCLLFV